MRPFWGRTEVAICPNSNELYIFAMGGDGKWALEHQLKEVRPRVKAHDAWVPPCLDCQTARASCRQRQREQPSLHMSVFFAEEQYLFSSRLPYPRRPDDPHCSDAYM